MNEINGMNLYGYYSRPKTIVNDDVTVVGKCPHIVAPRAAPIANPHGFIKGQWWLYTPEIYRYIRNKTKACCVLEFTSTKILIFESNRYSRDSAEWVDIDDFIKSSEFIKQGKRKWLWHINIFREGCEYRSF
mgnify:FL=1|tara:strand:- start:382 stop:777 length:396 start_codon:yes stop_codon:yes gene_type:complete